MKITISEKMPSNVRLGKSPTDFKNVKKIVEIPDELIDHTIAIINELFDRSNQPRKIDDKNKLEEMEKDSKYIDVIFPVFPNGFHQVEKIHKDGTMEIIKNVKWNNYWAEFPYKDIPVKRISILKILSKTNFVFVGDLPDPKLLEYVENKGMVIDIDRDKLIELRKKLVAQQEKFYKKPGEKISFRYKKYGEAIYGVLQIDGCPEIRFQKRPAAILKFFRQANESSKGYKIYKDFNAYFADDQNIKNIGSNEFGKTIESINKRVNKETSGLIKEIIVKGDSQKNQANTYRWNENA